MVSKRVKEYFGRVFKKLGEVDKRQLAASLSSGAVSIVPIVGPVIAPAVKDIIGDLLPTEEDRLIKELQDLSKDQLREISEEIGVSIESIKDIHQLVLIQFGQLSADHQEIIRLQRHILDALDITKIYIPTIQSLLEKGRVLEGQFFRKEPKWVDFEEGLIVEREEVNEIIDRLEDNNVLLVLGAPASGKSVLLKNLGFRLANSGFNVHFIELKTCPIDRLESYFLELQNTDDEKTVIIIDDAHLQLEKCKQLVTDFRNNELKTKLVVGTRNVKELESTSRKTSVFEELTRIEIDATDVCQDIIELFMSSKYNIRDAHQIQTTSEYLDIFKHDLWNLSYALEFYDIYADEVVKEKVYSTIYEYITEINGEDIFLPLSILYRFEIPVWKIFLTETLGIDDSLIDNLTGISEINQIEEEGGILLALQHSSLASLYIDVYRSKKFWEKGQGYNQRKIWIYRLRNGSFLSILQFRYD